MAYLSLYRKYRPQSFTEAVGQEHIVRTLTNALKLGRVAHAYLFAGPRGTGKTTFARLLAKGLNCEEGPTGTPCNECANCKRITSGFSVDVMEIDGASNRGIDEIRELRERVRFAPTEGKSKVYIIDEVHMLTNEAFNALLKVLEEPPAHVVFVFATTEAHKIPATILSRCQKFDFRRFNVTQLLNMLQRVTESEGVVAEAQALALVARHSEGGMRDALAILDQCLAFQPEQLSVKTVVDVLGIVRRDALAQFAHNLLSGEMTAGLQLLHNLLDEGVEVRQLAKDLTAYLRDLMLLKLAPELPELVVVDENEKAEMKRIAGEAEVDALLQVVEAMGSLDNELRWAANPGLAMEVAMVKALTNLNKHSGGAKPTIDVSLERRIAALENHIRLLGRGQPAPSTTTTVKAAEAEKTPRPDRPRVSEEAPPKVVPTNGKGDDGKQAEADKEQVALSSSGDETGVLERLQTGWQDVLASLREERMLQTEAFLREGTPGAVSGRVVVVYFSPKHKFHQANMERPRSKSAAERVISRYLGMEIQLQTELGTPPEPRQSESQGEKPPISGPEASRDEQAATGEVDEPESIRKNPAVSKALELFGGQITSVQREEDVS